MTNIKELIRAVGSLINPLIAILVGIALLAFFWGLVKFIFAQGSETSKLESKKIMGWGLIALFVMVSVWGIIRFIQNAIGLPSTTSPWII
mgnify:CR=1 FL=1